MSHSHYIDDVLFAELVSRLSFEQKTLLVSESPDYKLVVKIPLPETDTLAKLHRLLANPT